MVVVAVAVISVVIPSNTLFIIKKRQLWSHASTQLAIKIIIIVVAICAAGILLDHLYQETAPHGTSVQ